MKLEYQGERFRVNDRAWENFKIQYPERVKKIKQLKDDEEYSFDKLVQITKPSVNETKEVILKNYTYACEKEDDAAMNSKYDEMEKYFGAKEMCRKISIELINYDPEQHPEEVEEYILEKLEKEKKLNEEMEQLRKVGFFG